MWILPVEVAALCDPITMYYHVVTILPYILLFLVELSCGFYLIFPPWHLGYVVEPDNVLINAQLNV